MTPSRTLGLITATCLVGALGVAFVIHDHSTAKAATVKVDGVTADLFADHAITITAPTGDATITQSQAEKTATDMFGAKTLTSQLADCAQNGGAGTLCWVEVSDPTGQTITPGGPAPTKPQTDTGPYKVDYEYTLVDAKTGDVIIAVQHAPNP